MKRNNILLTLLSCLLIAWVSPAAAKKVEIIVKTGDFSNVMMGTPEREASEKKIAGYNLQAGDDLVFKGSMNKADFDGMSSLFPNGPSQYNPLVYNSIDITGLEITKYTDEKGVVHPAGVIPPQAFQASGKLKAKKIIMGNNIVGFGARAFSRGNYDNTITEIVMPTTSLKTIGVACFEGIRELKTFTLPESVTEISASAFSGFVWPGITSLTFHTGLKKLGAENFRNSELTQIILPNGLEELGGDATFAGSKLTSFHFPDGVKIVDYPPVYVSPDPVEGVLANTFAWCADLTSVTNLPKSVTTLRGTFQGTKITQIELHEGITEISDHAFPETLTSLTLPSTVTTLERAALMGLNQIETLELPASINIIANRGLYYMSSLKKLVVHNPNPDVLNYWSKDWGEDEPTKKESQNVFEGIVKEGEGACVLYVPAESVEAYKNARLWGEFKTIVAIGSDAKAQSIENFNDFTAFVGDEPITLGATSDAGDRTITYEVEKGKESVATVEGDVLTIKGAGTIKITAKAEGDFEWLAADKTVTLTVKDYSWLQAPAIAVNGNTVSVVGPGSKEFTLITLNGKEGTDLTDVTGEVKIVASTADGKQTIRLVINR